MAAATELSPAGVVSSAREVLAFDAGAAIGGWLSMSRETTGHSDGCGAGSRMSNRLVRLLWLRASELDLLEEGSKDEMPPAAMRLKNVSVRLIGIYAPP